MVGSRQLWMYAHGSAARHDLIDTLRALSLCSRKREVIVGKEKYLRIAVSVPRDYVHVVVLVKAWTRR